LENFGSRSESCGTEKAAAGDEVGLLALTATSVRFFSQSEMNLA
jgi:hypothetical protein